MDGGKVRITDARLQPGGAAGPGVVASVSEEGVLIGGVDGSILARKMSGASGPAVPAHEFAQAQGVKPGLRFLNPKLME
jgi:methionyl-tRNA formyltransferase